MVLVHLQVVRQVHHQAEVLHAVPLQLVVDKAHNAHRPRVVVGHTGRDESLQLLHLLRARRPRHPQRPGMRHGAVHRPDASVPLDLEPPQDFRHGLNVLLCVGVRLQEVKKHKIRAVLSAGVEDVAVWDGQRALALVHVSDGTIAREVEVRPGRAEPPKLMGIEMGLQLAQGNGADASGVHPGRQQREDVGVSELGEGFMDFKRSDIHSDMLAQQADFSNSQRHLPSYRFGLVVKLVNPKFTSKDDAGFHARCCCAALCHPARTQRSCGETYQCKPPTPRLCP